MGILVVICILLLKKCNDFTWCICGGERESIFQHNKTFVCVTVGIINTSEISVSKGICMLNFSRYCLILYFKETESMCLPKSNV